jgi:hypothetical protein
MEFLYNLTHFNSMLPRPERAALVLGAEPQPVGKLVSLSSTAPVGAIERKPALNLNRSTSSQT